MRFHAAKFILDTVKIAPTADDIGLWNSGPASGAENLDREMSNEDEDIVVFEYDFDYDEN